jgi:hypothetical protein
MVSHFHFLAGGAVVAVAKDLRGNKVLNNSHFLSRVVLRNEYCFRENVSINRLIMAYGVFKSNCWILQSIIIVKKSFCGSLLQDL